MNPYREPPPCNHGVLFDEQVYLNDQGKPLSSYEVRKRWPRLSGECPLGCGFSGIGYFSFMHYVAGDW